MTAGADGVGLRAPRVIDLRRMQRLATWALLAGLCLSASAAHAQPAQVTLDGCPATIASGSTFIANLDIALPVGLVLGAYQVKVLDNPQQVIITKIQGGSSFGFTGTPIFNSSSFATGTTTVNQFQTDPEQPTGTVNVAMVMGPDAVWKATTRGT